MKHAVTLTVCPACKNSFVPSIDKNSIGLSLTTCPKCLTEFEARQKISGNLRANKARKKRGS